jgi:hypothetical protein
MTSLPIVETFSNDMTTYIPTNLISIADGQFFLDSSVALEGLFPAISLSYSVSRIGAKAQLRSLKTVAPFVARMLSDHTHYGELLNLGQTLSNNEIYLYNKGKCLTQFLIQRDPRFSEITLSGVMITQAGFICPLHSKERNAELHIILQREFGRWVLQFALISKRTDLLPLSHFTVIDNSGISAVDYNPREFGLKGASFVLSDLKDELAHQFSFVIRSLGKTYIDGNTPEVYRITGDIVDRVDLEMIQNFVKELTKDELNVYINPKYSVCFNDWE